MAARDWSVIEFVPLGSLDLDIARAYYLDYPLLFLNVFSAGEQIVIGEGRSPLDYLIPIEADIVDDYGVYVVRCLEGDSATVNVDSEDVDLKCNGIANLSKSFYASSVRTGASSQTYVPRRFVF